MEQILTAGFAELGLSLPAGAPEKFLAYYELIEARNELMNLTAIRGAEDVARLHFLDCAALLAAAEFRGKTVLDVGSGAGFPGIPLKIACPDMELTLLDSQRKRVAFLEETVSLLGLGGVDCVHGRAEENSKLPEMRERFDIAAARALSRLNVLCELCLPYVKPGGVFIAMKGPDCAEELDESRNAIEKLGGELSGVFRYTIPGTDIGRSAALIAKTGPTPAEYPRRMARIKNSPL